MKCPHCNHEVENFPPQCTQRELIAYCVDQGLTAQDGDYLFNHWEASGWRNGGNGIHNWQATVKAWKSAGYFPSQKDKVTAATIKKSFGHQWRDAFWRLFPEEGMRPSHFSELPEHMRSKIKEHLTNGQS